MLCKIRVTCVLLYNLRLQEAKSNTSKKKKIGTNLEHVMCVSRDPNSQQFVLPCGSEEPPAHTEFAAPHSAATAAHFLFIASTEQ